MEDKVEPEGTKVEKGGEKSPELKFAENERRSIEKLERRDDMGVLE